MANLNRVYLMGRVTKDPELRYTPKGTAVAELGLAVNRTWTDEQNVKRDETTFVDVTLWGRTAEVAGQYLRKGRPVFIEGRLSLDTWTDKQSGEKRSRLKIIGEHMQLLGSKEASAAPSPENPAPATRPGQPAWPRGVRVEIEAPPS
jgi:single-strand DNA-binding protein